MKYRRSITEVRIDILKSCVKPLTYTTILRDVGISRNIANRDLEYLVSCNLLNFIENNGSHGKLIKGHYMTVLKGILIIKKYEDIIKLLLKNEVKP